jgi:hypothetical protein
MVGRAQAEVPFEPPSEPALQERLGWIGRCLVLAEASCASDHLVVDRTVALQLPEKFAHRLLGLDPQSVALGLELLETLAGKAPALLASTGFGLFDQLSKFSRGAAG